MVGSKRESGDDDEGKKNGSLSTSMVSFDVLPFFPFSAAPWSTRCLSLARAAPCRDA
jgi:hypothetical protein